MKDRREFPFDLWNYTAKGVIKFDRHIPKLFV